MTRHTAATCICFALCCFATFAQQQPTPAKPIDALGQPGAPLPAYDVVSIRENQSGSTNMRWQYSPNSFSGENITPTSLLVHAYGLRPDQISGAPSWASSRRLDVKAKVVDGDLEKIKHLSRQQRLDMLLPVLRERFGLRVHFETREMPVYELVPAKGGAKTEAMQPNPADTEPKGSFMFGRERIEMTSAAISVLTNALSFTLERDVIDKTNLTGLYTVKLKWSLDPGASDSDAAPSLFTAIQEQLGLRLQSAHGPVKTLIVDHLEPPTSNEN